MLFEQGDIIEINFSPTVGHEPKNKRPALVISSSDFNADTSMTIVCPITNTDNGFFLHLPLPARQDVSGFIVAEQIRALDLSERKSVFIGHLSEKEMLPILTCIRSFFG